MAANTTIEWATKSWNPVRGCSRVSPGCDECYAMKFAHRFSGAGKPYEGLTTIRRGKVDWSGVARFIPKALDEPLRWKLPERVFVNSMSDLFHHSLTDAEIMRVWMVMGRCPQHEFLVLTKHPDRALRWLDRWSDAGQGDPVMARGPAEIRERHKEGRALMFAEILDGMGEPPPGAAFPTYDWMEGVRWWPAALPNVWLGTSVENQETAGKRIPALLACPAAVRWISAEPLLGQLDLALFLRPMLPGGRRVPVGLDWVVCGGESGPGARPYDIAWPKSVIEQCRAAGVPVFHKQLGAVPVVNSSPRIDERGQVLDDTILHLKNRKGGDPGEWPEDLRVREFPRSA